MMMVETELRPSAIHGLGVFLLEPVRKGGLIWRFDSRIDRVYAPAEIASLPGHVQRYLRTYCTWHEGAGLYVLCGDNGRYFNHAQAPSTVSNAVSFGEDHAARDLAAGEELTSDYATICDEVRKNGADFLAPPRMEAEPTVGEVRVFAARGGDLNL
jgi:hypothetical protein